MPEMRWFLSIVLLLLAFQGERQSVEAAPRKGIIQGAREVNLRVGPGVDYGVKDILKENERLMVEEQQDEWYLVETAGGQKGYVSKNLVKIVGEEPATEFKEPNTPTVTDAPATGQPSLEATTSPTPPIKTNQPAGQSTGVGRKTDDRRTPAKKAPSLLELLEGRETDMMVWAAIAIIFFLMGWICGGKYYLRRDRVRRTKLRF